MGPGRTRARHDSQRRIKKTGSTCCRSASARAGFLETRDQRHRHVARLIQEREKERDRQRTSVEC